MYVSHLGNIGLHVSWAATHRRYDPGMITAVATLAPVAVTGLRRLLTDPEISRRSVGAGAAGGLLLSVVLVPALKWRLHRRR